MSRLLVLGLLPAAFATGAFAQTPDPHAGHHMPAPAQQAAHDPHAHHRAPAAAPAPEPDPHAHHRAPAPQPEADPHAQHRAPDPAAEPDPHAHHRVPAPAAEPDPHAGHGAAAPADPHAGHAVSGADLPVGNAAPPPPAADKLADAVYGRAPMERSRDLLNAEHGGMPIWNVFIDRLEVAPADDAFGWEAEYRFGGDVNRLVLKTEGEGDTGGDVEEAEVQALWSRAVGPYFDLQAGLRYDLQPRPRRAYAVAGFEGLAPYWFEVEGAAFLSDEGDVTARLEGSFDWRLTQRLILERRGEVELSAQDVPELGIGAGVSSLKLGLRLRYELMNRELAPYVGLEWERKLGETADLARAAGEDVGDSRIVVGLKSWF